MADHKRTKLQREKDLLTIAGLLDQEVSQIEIAERLGVSRAQVCYDVRTLEKRLEAQSTAEAKFKRAQNVAREVKKLTRIAERAWQAWQRTTQDEETLHTSKEAGRTRIVTDRTTRGTGKNKVGERRRCQEPFFTGIQKILARRRSAVKLAAWAGPCVPQWAA
jgi:hypothetical protein